MAFTEGGQDGVLNGTSEITMVTAPGAGVRRLIKSIQINNKDTAQVTISIFMKNNTTNRTIWSGTLDSGDTWLFGDEGDLIILDATNKSIVARLDAAPATLNPDFVSSFGDVS